MEKFRGVFYLNISAVPGFTGKPAKSILAPIKCFRKKQGAVPLKSSP
jgi:hypothetical protein